MTSNRQPDILFQLIQSMEKAEKRHFKLYIKPNSDREDLKIVRLFDALDKMTEYDEKQLLKKLTGVEKPQLANLKTHLYRQIMSSLRDLKSKDSVELQLNEMLDYGRILYNKGLFLQSLKFLEKAKEIGFANGKYNFLSQVISLEKKIEGLYITRSMQQRAELLSKEAIEVSGHIYQVFRLSNLAVRLYSFYIENGHSRNAEDEEKVKTFFLENLPPDADTFDGFYERLYLYQSYCWYSFIRQDFLMYYRYAQKWVSLFNEDPIRMKVETGHYIKGMHNLLNAHFDLRNFKEFEASLKEFEDFYQSPLCQQHNNFRIHSFIYITGAKLNWHLMAGTFKEGLQQAPIIEENIRKYELHLDKHRILVFNYKIASLHFGYGNHKAAIDYLQKIIHEPIDLRYDLQCYARLMHLMAHYELGNDMIIESLARSVYRFMSKMKNLTGVEEAMFAFLRKSLNLSSRQIKPELDKLLEQVKQFEKDRHETRAFAYLDIISWLESKVQGVPMGIILKDKYNKSKHK
ncbi:MAG TPA: hypothetical protein VLC98_12550 [Phnomibacter sp.]|nr:hypothetical protein [Phnomibacter sp.]